MNKNDIQSKLKIAKDRLELYYQAERAVLSGAQSYTIGSRNLTRADLAEIRKMITSLEDDVAKLESALAGYGSRRCVRVIPRDV